MLKSESEASISSTAQTVCVDVVGNFPTSPVEQLLPLEDESTPKSESEAFISSTARTSCVDQSITTLSISSSQIDLVTLKRRLITKVEIKPRTPCKNMHNSG